MPTLRRSISFGPTVGYGPSTMLHLRSGMTFCGLPECR